MYRRKDALGMTRRVHYSLAITDAVRLPLNSIESSPKSDFVSNLHIVFVLCRTDPYFMNVNYTFTSHSPNTMT